MKVKEVAEHCKRTGASNNPAEILRHLQTSLVCGRALEVTCQDNCPEGLTNFVMIDRQNLLRTAFEEIQSLEHRIRIHRRATRVGAFEVFEAAHVALRTLLAFSQPVNCIFWPIGMLNWLVAASKLHKHRVTCCTAEWPFYVFLFYGLENKLITLEVQFYNEVSLYFSRLGSSLFQEKSREKQTRNICSILNITCTNWHKNLLLSTHKPRLHRKSLTVNFGVLANVPSLSLPTFLIFSCLFS